MVRVGILARESTPLANFIKGWVGSAVITAVTGLPIPIEINDEPYDISKARGTDLDAMVLLVDIAANGSVRATGDGAGDGGSETLEARVLVKVDHGSY